MISRSDIIKAIEECQGEQNPNSTTCMKLAAYYIILNHMGGNTMSFASEPVESVSYISDTEFSEAIQGVDINDILMVMEELMDGVKTMLPRLYNVTIERLKAL